MRANSGGSCATTGACSSPFPRPDDLIELRGSGRDRVARTLDTFANGFQLMDKRRVVYLRRSRRFRRSRCSDFDLPADAAPARRSDAT